MENQLVELTAETALTVFTVENGLDPYVQQVKDEVNNFEHDLSTKAGRGRSASLAAKVAKMKVKLDNLGKDLVAEWKNNAKKVDGTRKKMRDDLDELKVIARKPLSDWEDEQQKIEDEKQAKLEAEMKVAQVESDHEIGLLMNEKIDRDLADEKLRVDAQKAEAEKVAKERLDAEKAEAAYLAKVAAEMAAQELIHRAEKEKQEAEEARMRAKIAAEESERALAEAVERQKIDAQLAEERRIEAVRQEEARRIEAAQKASQEADQAAENARLREVERQKQEEAAALAEQKKREANKKHKGLINRGIVDVLLENGISAEDAKTVVTLAAKLQLPNLTINY